MIKILTFCVLLFCTSSFANTTRLGCTEVTFTNNTDRPIFIHSQLATKDKNFRKGKDWDETTLTLGPYLSAPVLWFSRNVHLKAKENYRFDLMVKSAEKTEELIVSFTVQGKPFLGSSISTELSLPKEKFKKILTQRGLEKFPANFLGKNYIFYAKNWLPISKVFSDFHFVIHQIENHSFDTKYPHQLSVLSYNTQMMPFYAGIVDHLNQPDIRAQDIPAKISNFDAIIFQELFDHALRNKIIQSMQPYYLYHTDVAGHAPNKVLTGGIMIFSKWPILQESQYCYKAGTNIDKLAAKGVIHAMINKQGKIYHLFGTHLQAGNSPGERKVKHQQLKELAQFIAASNIPKDQPILIGGDFNIDERSQDATTLSSTLSATIIKNIGYLYSVDGLVNTMNINKTQMRIDYVLFNNLHVHPKLALNKVFILRDFDNTKMWPNFDLSDHFPIASYFEFSEG